MKLKPLKQWICDTCGELIEKPDDGCLEWHEDTRSFRFRDFRIVHHAWASPREARGRNCYQNVNHPERSDSCLDVLVGADGMAVMIAWPYSPGVENQKEWAEIFRRLHVPNYESARRYWDNAVADGFFEDADEEAKYSQEMLKRIIALFNMEAVGANSSGD